MSLPVARQLYPRPWVMIVGRTNVGKSTLYNKLLSGHGALVSRQPGTTRDVAQQICVWQGRHFTLIDSGGLELPPNHRAGANEDPYIPLIHEQLNRALKGVDTLLFIVDVKSGLMPQDRAWAQWLRRGAKRVILVANKADKASDRANAHEFECLAFGTPILCSAWSGSGTGDLLDAILQPTVSPLPIPTPPTPNFQLLLLGKTNVGKSTLANALVGYNAMITSPMPHTTRGPQELLVESEDTTISIIDTAGIRKHATKNSFLESVGSALTKQRLSTVDLVVLIVDPFEVRVSSHDRTLAQWIHDEHRAAMIVVNKIDLLPELLNDDKRKQLEQAIRSNFPHLSYAPTLLCSAQHARGLKEFRRKVQMVIQNFRRFLTPEQLEDFTSSTSLFHSSKGRPPMRWHLTQSSTAPPEFVLSMKRKQQVPFALLKRLEKTMREQFDLVGTPIVIHVKRTKTPRQAVDPI